MNQYFFDTKKYLLEDKYFRNYIELLSVIITGFIGSIYFSKESKKDIGFLWKLIYITGGIFLLITTLIDNYIFQISKDGQYRFYAMKSIMTGPIIFLVLTIIKRVKN
jgi:hypothetical protein